MDDPSNIQTYRQIRYEDIKALVESAYMFHPPEALAENQLYQSLLVEFNQLASHLHSEDSVALFNRLTIEMQRPYTSPAPPPSKSPKRQIIRIEVTTPHQQDQARRKLDALVLGGWDIHAMIAVEHLDTNTGNIRQFRELVVSGKTIKQNTASDL